MHMTVPTFFRAGWADPVTPVHAHMGVSRRSASGCGRSRAHLNGAAPYLTARAVYGGADGAPAKVDGENCARGGIAGGTHGRWSAERYKARRGRAGIVKGVLGRRSAVGMRVRRERARTVCSLK